MRPPPSILHVECATTYGGSVRCLENFLKAKQDREFRHIICLYTPLPAQERLARFCDQLWIMPSTGKRYQVSRPSRRIAQIGEALKNAVRLCRLMRRENVRLVRLNNAPAAHLGALIAARTAHVPLVAWLRSYPRSSERRWHWLTALSPHFVAVSESVRQAYIAQRIPSHRITTLYDGTEIPPLSCKLPKSPLHGEQFRIGSLGRLVSWKGLIDMVRAAGLVLHAHPQARFEIVGEEDPAEPGHKAELLSEIDRLKVNEAVTLRGFCTDPREYVRSLSCFVNPSSRSEPFGMSILEAMAYSIPVIATASGGPAEIIEHGRSGILIPPRDHAALASAIKLLIRDNALCATISVESRYRIAHHFEITRQVALQENLLLRLLRDNATPTSHDIGDPTTMTRTLHTN